MSNTISRPTAATKVAVATELLSRVTGDIFALTNMDIEIVTELRKITARLDKIAFALEYPDAAAKNRTLTI